MNTIVNSTGIAALGTGQSVLGERQTNIPTSGKIRSGIKVLTPSARQNPKAQAIYDAGIAAGKTFVQIERELIEQCKFERSPLTPRNVPYFTVRRADFPMPEIADTIMKLYGESRAEGLHLYRFPAIFPVDAWQAVMRHGLNCYTRSERVYWSDYGPDGTRYCKTHGVVEVDPQSKRAHRPFGGRPVILRAENDGRCEPERCKEYQARKCNLTGSFLFYVPGVPGSSAIELPTTSFYSMQQARQKLEMVAFIRGGRISGTENGRPIFYLAKKQHEVSMIDPETGQAKKVKQWLIELEADIDMTKLFIAGESQHLLAAGETAAQALEHKLTDDAEFDTVGEPVEPEVTAAPETPPPTAALTDEQKAQVAAARKGIQALIGQFEGFFTIEQFGSYATGVWGQNCMRDLECLRKIHKDLNAGLDDINEYTAHVRGRGTQ